MPLGGLLVGVGRSQHSHFVEGAARELQADGHAVVAEPAGHRDGREAGEVEGSGVLGQGG